MQMLKNALTPNPTVVIQRYSRDSRSDLPVRPSPPSRDVTLRFPSFFLYLRPADKSTGDLHPLRSRLLSSRKVIIYALRGTRRSIIFSSIFARPLNSYVPHAAGEARYGCARVRKTPARDERLVSLGAHADVTVAKHVLIICKRKQVGPRVFLRTCAGDDCREVNQLASRYNA